MLPNDAIARSYAAASQEVVVDGWIPPTAIVATIDFMQSFGPHLNSELADFQEARLCWLNDEAESVDRGGGEDFPTILVS